MFQDDVIKKWQGVWNQLCLMAYERRYITSKLMIYPETLNEQYFYERNSCKNSDELTLDYMWQKYSGLKKEAQVVPELTRIYVPRSLFECLGVYAWFKHSFPNCKIQFWEDIAMKNTDY